LKTKNVTIIGPTLSQASRAMYRGLSNEQFHVELFQRVLANYAKGKFQFLSAEDLAGIQQIIELLQ
jgi:hypothetical protein